MIVLDEHLQGLELEDAIGQWYRGSVCIITDLRPNTVIKDDAIPVLLRTVSNPTFVTLNWNHFWQRTVAYEDFCIVCFTLPTNQATEISPLLRRLFRLSEFKTKSARMGKVARISAEQVAYYQAHDSQTYLLPLP
jgi:hypothetical protein